MKRIQSVSRVLGPALLLLLLASCGEDVNLPAFPDEGALLPAANAPVVRTGDREVRLDWDLVPGASRYHVFRDDGEGSIEEQVATLSASGWTDYDVVNHTTYRYRLAAAMSDGTEGPRSPRAFALPAIYSILIGEGQPEVATPTVSVQLGAPQGTAWMRLAEAGHLDGAVWQPFREQHSWRFIDGDGSYTLQAEYRDSLDNRSLPVSGSVVLDSQAIILGFGFTPGGVVSPSDIIQFTLSAGELGGWASAEIGSLTTVPLLDDGVAPDVLADDGLFTGRWVVSGGLDAEVMPVWGHYIDRLENEALPYLAPTTITVLDGTP